MQEVEIAVNQGLLLPARPTFESLLGLVRFINRVEFLREYNLDGQAMLGVSWKSAGLVLGYSMCQVGCTPHVEALIGTK
jgi:hypothetical protein